VSACPTLATERLILRPFSDNDLGAFTEVLRSPEVRASLHLPDDINREAAWNQMAAWLGQWQLRGTGHWAAELKATGEFLGRAGLHRPERPGWPGVEIGWVLHPRHWGHGYATEAGKAAVDYAFDVLGLPEVFSVILPENGASQAVAKRLGFTLIEERVLSHFPSMPHGIWRLLSADRSA
jgi:RimJ/RimL family protein N-acetyltransferase